MEALIDGLFQRVPLIQLAIPDDLDTVTLLPVLQEISELNGYYIRQFLQKLFKNSLDQDDYYELFASLVMSRPSGPTDTDCVTYNIDGGKIWIQETPRLISGSGTTGLRTWEAALFLSHWIVSHRDRFKDKRVLELGAGTGLVSLTLLKSADIKSLLITDGNSTLIDALSTNFQLNGITYPSSSMSCQQLWWGQDTVPKSDIIVAADVTYDSSIVPSLVGCLEEGLETAKEAYIAATVRNNQTLKVFEEALSDKLSWDVVEYCEEPSKLNQRVWYPPTTPGIKIYRIEKK